MTILQVNTCAQRFTGTNATDTDNSNDITRAEYEKLGRRCLIQSGSTPMKTDSQEVTILSSLEHPLIINLVTLFHDEKRICIIYECADLSSISVEFLV